MLRSRKMQSAIEAVRADREVLLEICAGLTDQQWQADSGCPGWTVQDVILHLSNLFFAVVDASRLPDTAGMPTEQAQESAVQARRGLPASDVLAEYKQVSEAALERLGALAATDMVLPLGDLGTYPASAIPSAYAFDHYTHIRADLFAPRGPLDGAAPPSDELRVNPALDWIEAALPQQNQAAAAAGRFELEITGTGARMITFGSGHARAMVSSDAPSFVRWVTQRASWESVGVKASGEDTALSVARTLKVF
jgi:uncharacterized protein (TIGR03083 family)